MTNKNKVRGYRFENTLMNKFKKQFDWDCIRLGQPGQPDLLAIHGPMIINYKPTSDRRILIIECKSTISKTKPIRIKYNQLQTLHRYATLFRTVLNGPCSAVDPIIATKFPHATYYHYYYHILLSNKSKDLIINQDGIATQLNCQMDRVMMPWEVNKKKRSQNNG